MVAPPDTPRLEKLYKETVAPKTAERFELRNVHQRPRLIKIVINCGIGRFQENQKLKPEIRDAVTATLTTITGQRPVSTKARRSVAGFKLREGQAIGVMVTLRGDRMYIFLDKLFNTALPRIRDFRGVSRSAFDGRGNYSLGIREQIVFPEIDYNQIDRLRGFQVNIITSAKTDQEALRLLELMGMPFARVQESERVSA
ncbi:MAG: 50S ribosomal protein L5 [Gemmatimonadetes bacterium]|nr:50S ribosomal protein L5 [Gemmatimonadota bacterium]